jgi:short-subunit dehydrogenase
VNLVLVARNAERLASTADAVRAAHGVEVRVLQLDLGTPAAADTLLASCADIEVGGLIFNAGAAHGLRPFLDQPIGDFLSLMRLNVETQVRVVHGLARGMRERRSGAIIFLGSGASAGGAASLAGYSAAKAYAQTFAEGLWRELQPYGVKVLCFVLGLTRTPAMARAGFNMDNGEFAVDEPDTVAATGLAQIDNGPVYAMESIRANIERLRTLPRREVVLSLSQSTERLT